MPRRRDKAFAGLLAIAAFSFAVDVEACSRIGGPPSEEETIKEADEIFVAHLVSASEIQFPSEAGELDEEDRLDLMGVQGHYVLIESLKGATAKEGVVHDNPAAPGNCSLGLMPGWDYVFFVKHDQDRPEFRWVGMFTGSVPLGPYRHSGDEEEKELTDLKTRIKQLAENRP